MFQKASGKLLSQAIELLNAGGILVFPTDTAFGVGCRIDKKKAVKRLFQIKKRPSNQPVPVLVDSVKMARRYLKALPREVEDLMERHWPGGLTIAFPCKPSKVPSLVRGGGKTLGVRMPDHKTSLYLIKAAGVPLLGPSANFYGEKTPYKFEELDKEFLCLVDLVIPGKCKEKLASTVVDCSKKPWQIIRQGAVEIEESLLS